ncbi:MAG: polysaccharide deacetylase family protein [Acidobacteria bacterium]|nr:polysaccharide deacetylase family protein [Acidobacteriota bacterium]
MLKKIILLLLLMVSTIIAGLPQGASPNNREASKIPAAEIPPKTIVLTFDDAVKSQLTVVAPLLKQLGFQATFFITQSWMKDKSYFLTWEETAELYRMGFEIGNHSWTHSNFGKAENGAKLGEELQMVEKELARVGVPKPVSFAWCGNAFGPEAIAQLRRHGYKLARRGMQPEVPYGAIQVGPALDVTKHHPLLIPTTGDAYPAWTLEHFKRVISSARPGEVVVLQFHGVPDISHPWVNTPAEAFREYMNYLKQNGYRTIAMRDLLQYYNTSRLPDDPLVKTRFGR